MNYPDDLKYTKQHEWLRIESETTVVVGITEYAADELGDVVFVELPDVGADVTAMSVFGEIESVKAVSELYSPVSGTVAERNEELDDTPELVNDLAYREGWMIKIEMSDTSQLDGLMSAADYEQFLATQ
jgi:glycine cleavage system H protein